MSKIKKQIQSTKLGMITIEAIFGLFIFLMMTILIIGIFCYTYPRQTLEKQVSVLAQQVKVTGGLTYSQMVEFQETLSDMGYEATISVYTKDTGQIALNVAPVNTSYSACTNTSIYNPYVTRDSGQKIIITVVVNSNNSLVSGALSYFGASLLPDNYTITETVMSERNRC